MSIVHVPITVPAADLQRVQKSAGQFWQRHSEVAERRKAVDAERESIRVERQRIAEGLREHQRVGEHLAAVAIEARRSLDEREKQLHVRALGIDRELRRQLSGESK